jgi:hypothetical protein
MGIMIIMQQPSSARLWRVLVRWPLGLQLRPEVRARSRTDRTLTRMKRPRTELLSLTLLAAAGSTEPAASLVPPSSSLSAAVSSEQQQQGCNYTAHANVTFLDGGSSNVISCQNDEGLAHCQQRCDTDVHCSGFGLYVRGPIDRRCCTKRNNLDPTAWSAGVSYTKQVGQPGCAYEPSKPPPPPPPRPPPPPIPPPPPSRSPVDVSVIFEGNASFPYNKGAMLQPLPGGRVAAACQAGQTEATSDQSILYAISADDGRTWPKHWAATSPHSAAAGAQWEPTLFLTPDNDTLWLFWSEGPGSCPSLLFAQTTTSASGFTAWSERRLIMNVSEHPGRELMYPISRVIISPTDGAWLLPCDWGCGGGGAPTGAFTMRSTSQGKEWSVDAPIPGIATLGLCPEPAMAVINGTSMLAVVRNTGTGFMQSWSHDGGHHWGVASKSPVDGAASKPALAAFTSSRHGRVLVLAYNVVTRERMALSTSTDGGASFQYFATLDNGTSSAAAAGERSDAYPTVVVDGTGTGTALLTTWSTYGGSTPGHYDTIKVARTELPDALW